MRAQFLKWWTLTFFQRQVAVGKPVDCAKLIVGGSKFMEYWLKYVVGEKVLSEFERPLVVALNFDIADDAATTQKEKIEAFGKALEDLATYEKGAYFKTDKQKLAKEGITTVGAKLKEMHADAQHVYVADLGYAEELRRLVSMAAELQPEAGSNVLAIVNGGNAFATRWSTAVTLYKRIVKDRPPTKPGPKQTTTKQTRHQTNTAPKKRPNNKRPKQKRPNEIPVPKNLTTDKTRYQNNPLPKQNGTNNKRFMMWRPST